MPIIELIRVKHWVKNLFVFIPIFLAGRLTDLPSFIDTLYAFIIFCLASSLVYVFNDLKDKNYDVNHPVKKHRPIASGKISSGGAGLILAFIIALLVLFLFLSNFKIWVVIALYILLNLIYSSGIKRVAILDVMFISIGFVLRVEAGVVAIDVVISSWLIIMTFCLSMLLGLGKRRTELLELGYQNNTRASLKGYSIYFLDSMLIVFSTIVIVVYLLYTVFVEYFPGNKPLLIYSSIFVIAGITRYVQLSQSDKVIEEPVNIFLQDRFILVMVILWMIYIGAIIYLLDSDKVYF